MIKKLSLRIRLYFVANAKVREVEKANFMKAASLRDKEKELLSELAKLNK